MVYLLCITKDSYTMFYFRGLHTRLQSRYALLLLFSHTSTHHPSAHHRRSHHTTPHHLRAHHPIAHHLRSHHPVPHHAHLRRVHLTLIHHNSGAEGKKWGSLVSRAEQKAKRFNVANPKELKNVE